MPYQRHHDRKEKEDHIHANTPIDCGIISLSFSLKVTSHMQPSNHRQPPTIKFIVTEKLFSNQSHWYFDTTDNE